MGKTKLYGEGCSSRQEGGGMNFEKKRMGKGVLIGRGQGEVGFECLMAWESVLLFQCFLASEWSSQWSGEAKWSWKHALSSWS